MFIFIVEKNGERVTKQNEDKIFNNNEQRERFWDWAWKAVPYNEAKQRVETLGYEVWEGDNGYGIEIPKKVSRFAIWRRVDPATRKPELIEFEGIKFKVKIS
jgi:hypothetical protein